MPLMNHRRRSPSQAYNLRSLLALGNLVARIAVSRGGITIWKPPKNTIAGNLKLLEREGSAKLTRARISTGLITLRVCAILATTIRAVLRLQLSVSTPTRRITPKECVEDATFVIIISKGKRTTAPIPLHYDSIILEN